jgi:hypothetical protein
MPVCLVHHTDGLKCAARPSVATTTRDSLQKSALRPGLGRLQAMRLLGGSTSHAYRAETTPRVSRRTDQATLSSGGVR